MTRMLTATTALILLCLSSCCQLDSYVEADRKDYDAFQSFIQRQITEEVEEGDLSKTKAKLYRMKLVSRLARIERAQQGGN